jgi:CxxC motif-containing protein (DUF1111 family)
VILGGAPSCQLQQDRAAPAELRGNAGAEANGTSSTRRRMAPDVPSQPLRGATHSERQRFKAGDALFEVVVREADGLGPLYIRDACVACHAADARGPGLVTKMVLREPARARAAALLPFGATERPYVAASATRALLAPQDDQVTTTVRQPPAVFGRGYLEAIAEAELVRLELEATGRKGAAGFIDSPTAGSAALVSRRALPACESSRRTL